MTDPLSGVGGFWLPGCGLAIGLWLVMAAWLYVRLGRRMDG